MMRSRCIFRYLYSDGTVCSEMSHSDECKYCNIHKKKQNYIFEIMEDVLGYCRLEDSNTLYKIFEYIYDNNTYARNDNGYLEIDNSAENKKNLFLSIVAYLLSKVTLLNILQKMGIINALKTKTKRNVIMYLYDMLMNTYTMSNNIMDVYKIIKIQHFLRKCLHNKITKYNHCQSENTEDPFTYDTIAEIPDNCKFSYKDEKGHIYIFNAIEFEYFVRTNGSWNPYTKADIPDYVINQLYILMQYNNLCQKSDDEFQWLTPLHAYTSVSQVMERAGFHTDVEWFNKITYKICENIIKSYRELCEDLDNGNVYFSREIELKKNTYVYTFCKEAINLFTDSDNHYLLCCNFMKALATNVNDFYKNMPRWLLEETRDQTPILFMYVQNMLDNIDQYSVIERRQFHLSNASISRIVFESFIER